MFGATNIVKNSDKENYVYSGYRIAFEVKGSWNFDNYFSRSVATFGVDNSSSPHTDNQKNYFLLSLRDTFGIDESFGAPGNSLVLILITQIWNFSWVCNTMVITVICLLTGNKIYKFKAIIKNVNFLS